MKKILLSLFVFMLIAGTTVAQNRTITGTVTDQSDGRPLPGVSVRIKGAVGGSQTNSEGKYSLSIPQGATSLEFSYIGYTAQSKPISTGNVINAVLQANATELGEVIVIAYGTATKESFTGSVGVVKAADLKDRPVTSVDKALQGTVPGLVVKSSSGQPGSVSQIRLRGVGSINSSAEPLYVIDGVPITVGGDISMLSASSNQSTNILSTLNSEDIESISVLKDAASAALYGSKAANGVLIITTKKGKAGKTKIQAGATFGYSDLAVKQHELLNASEYFGIYWDANYKKNIDAGQAPALATTNANKQTISILGANPYNTPTPYSAQGTLSNGAALLYDTDWRDAVLRTGKNKDYNVSASGGSETTKFYISGGYFDQEGIALASSFKRYSAKLNVENKATDFLTLGMYSTLSYTDQQAPSGGTNGSSLLGFTNNVSNVYSLYARNADGSIKYDVKGEPVYAFDNKIFKDYNPVFLSKNDKFSTQTARVLTSAFAEISFLKDFKFKSIFTVDYVSNRELLFYNMEHGDGVAVGGRASRFSARNLGLNITNTLTYNKKIGEHTFDVLLGQEASKTNYDLINAAGTGFPFPGVYELRSSSKAATADSYQTDIARPGYFSRVNYAYNNKYFLSASVRRDASSVFGTQSKWGTFWSVGGAWRLKQESFLQDVTWLTELKLRANYGTGGNDRFISTNNELSNYAALDLFELGFNYNGQGGTSYSQLGNPFLRWEKNANTDFALEFRLFNRLNGEVVYYKRASDGLLFAQPLSMVTGFKSLNTNLASMNNRGIEVNLNADAITSQDFSWNVGFNFAKNTNKITKLSQPTVISGSKRFKVGGDLYRYFIQEYAGVDPATGNAQWYKDQTDANGVTTKVKTSVYTDATNYEQGSAFPKLTGGFNNRFTYKGFDLGFMVYFSLGGKILDNNYQALTRDGASPGSQLSRDALNAWKNVGDITNTPKFVISNTTNSAQRSTRYLFDATYARLKTVSLGYSLPKDLMSKTGILQNARVYIMGENVLTWAKHKGVDPEFDFDGVAGNEIPNVKTFSFGLNIGF